ncbi:EF-hand domain-containing protein [Undibacterium sp. Ren11W]|uniref:EF-hand domain-containing protein n=1 Tax=Undibacterium sp. Ren11W TaxID=3413045 RepID=UPI003BF056AC
MSSIGSIGNSSAYSSSASNVQRQRPDRAKIADEVFSKIDTKSQGYLEVSDLESAFSKISAGTSSASDTATSSNAASVSDLFSKLDGDGDGKVTKNEFSSGLKKLSDALDSQFNASRTTDATGTQSSQAARGAHRPPPPSGGDHDDAGISQDQMKQMASDISKTNSAAGASLSKVAENFAAADTNEDGKVSMQETLAYLEKSTATATTNTSNTAASSASTSTVNKSASSASTDSNSDSASSNGNNSSDAAIFKKVQQLLHAYADPLQFMDKQNSGGISVSA